MASALRNVLTKKQFKEWLESSPPSISIGFANSHCACPLAKYMLSKAPLLFPHVSVCRVVVSCENIILYRYEKVFDDIIQFRKLTVTQKWIKQFISRLDQLYPTRGTTHESINVQIALDILNRMT